MKLATHVAWQVVGGEGVVVDLKSGSTIGLNPAATVILQNLGETPERMAEIVAGSFNIAIETAKTDVAEFLEVLEKRGLIARQA